MRHDGKLIAVITQICQLSFPGQLGGCIFSIVESAPNRQIIIPSSAFSRTCRLMKRPSALSALLDGLLVSAGAHFEKDRQKYRQFICCHRLKLAQRLSYYLCISISYAVSPPDLIMHLDHCRCLHKSLKYIDNLSRAAAPYSHSIVPSHDNPLIQQCKFFRRTANHRLSDPSEIRALDFKHEFRRSAICSISAVIGID